MNTSETRLFRYVLVSIATLVVTVLAIYLTPLKNINLIEPTILDEAPVAFQTEYKADTGKYLFIDVRPSEAFNRAHAVGSISMPLHTLYNTRHSLPKSGKEIVLICNEGIASGVAYHYLQHFGFFNIRRIGGGVERWTADGLPIEGTAVAPTR